MGDNTRPRAIPLAMSTMKKETLGSHNFYAWFSFVSPISIGMGFAPRPLGPAKLRYYKKTYAVSAPKIGAYVRKYGRSRDNQNFWA